jgi:hypothetical protein
MTGRVASALALAGLAVVPGVASAASVSQSGSDAPVFRAARDEVNRLVVTESGGWVVFSDRLAVVTASGRCRPLSLHSVRCPRRGSEATVRLGDRSDALTVRLPVDRATFVWAGAGDDQVVGRGRGSEIAYGGTGRDVLRGGPSGDFLHAGSGRDHVMGGRGPDRMFDDRRKEPTSRDVFDGGAGRDQLDYRLRRSDFTIDLMREPAEAGPERDVVRRVEAVETGAGADRLFGNGRDNVLVAGAGRNFVKGRGGSDALYSSGSGSVLSGGPGSDNLSARGGSNQLIGGEGHDQLESFEAFAPLDRSTSATPSRVRCGPGLDTAISAPWDVVAGCENATGWEYALNVEIVPAFDGDDAVFQVNCEPVGGCSGTVLLQDRMGQTEFGRTSIDIPWTRGNRTAPLEVPLTPDGDAAVEAGTLVRATFRSGRDMEFSSVRPGTRLTFGFTSRWRRPPPAS